MDKFMNMKMNQIIRELKKLFPNAKMMLNYSNNWELLVAVMLSAQCTDKKVNEVTSKLFVKYKKLEDYANAYPKEFEKDIFSTGFYRAKTKHIIESANIIKQKFNGEIPQGMKEMLALPGVARKTANVVLGNAYNIVEGIAVDTHVRRLSLLMGLTTSPDPIKIENDLMNIVPKSEWFQITYLFIEYGRKYCKAKRHLHLRCPLAKYDK